MAAAASPAFLLCLPLLHLLSGWSRAGRAEPPSLTPGTTEPKAMATTLSPWGLLIIFLCFILAGR
ncbi:UL16-binding protein 1 isoform X2 [Nomascus leucogenys]|uniref:UL16-binding protein 1 isoform X2 n=1 Tax=Nomascus leucogenys TaxID=61853 RepID=UPI00122D5495|nr:UL16-binding protein 1 isoform X2 [Nomascus leucogenys]